MCYDSSWIPIVYGPNLMELQVFCTDCLGQGLINPRYQVTMVPMIFIVAPNIFCNYLIAASQQC